MLYHFLRAQVWRAQLLFSYYSSRRKNTSTLRVITLRGGRILRLCESLPLYASLLFEKEEHFHSTIHYSSRGILPLYESLCTSCGKPSTWFPHEELVECLFKKKIEFLRKIKIIKKTRKSHFSYISKIEGYHRPCRGIIIFMFYQLHINLQTFLHVII